MSIYCPKCGARNGDGDLVCAVCGKELRAKTKIVSPTLAVAVVVLIIILGVSLTPFFRPLIDQTVSGVAKALSSMFPTSTSTTTVTSASTSTSTSSTTVRETGIRIGT